MMKKTIVGLALAALLLLTWTASATAAPPPAKTLVVVLTAADEVPLCAPATNSARGVAIFHVRDEATGSVHYKVVANNLPGTITAAHIHIAPSGDPGPVVQALPLVPGEENGVIGEGTFNNPGLLAAIRANPGNYYVNVHTGLPDGCPSGVIRGQLGEHGPARR